LGGDGYDPRNLVTLYQNPTNTPVMAGFEGRVRSAVEAGETVALQVVPVYNGTDPIPVGISMPARGSNGFSLDVFIQNSPGTLSP
jgi:hypothetical protein